MNYAQKLAAEREAIIKAACAITRQMCLDTLQAAIHESEGWGYDRILRLCGAWMEKFNLYHDALDAKNPEADYLRECLDRELQDIVKERKAFIPFEERYPEAREIRYGRRK